MQFLLERLEFAGAAPAQSGQSFNLRDAVRLQIQRLVSSHVWAGSTGLELMRVGLPSLTGAGYAQKDDIQRYSLSIRDMIVRHEPRLTGVRVTVEETRSSVMPFQVVVTGKLADQPLTETFSFGLPRR